MTTNAWNPDQYERFKSERSLPFFDLLARVQPGVDRAVDLGCGTGELTAILHQRTSARLTIGVDSSSAMLDRARQIDVAGLRFESSDLRAWSPESQVDLVFSNAALQWVPDHRPLLERLTGLLAPGGQLAIQVPANFDHPSHLSAVKVAATEPFRSALGGFHREVPVLAPEAYAELLFALGYREQQVSLNVYPHVLQDRDAVVEWVKGTLLTTYQERLTPDLYDRFLTAFRAHLAATLPDDRPFFYPFKRILIWGRKE